MKNRIVRVNNNIYLVTDMAKQVEKEESVAILKDGIDTLALTETELSSQAEDVTEQLVIKPFEHVMSLAVSGEESEIMKMVDMMMLQCMEMTARGVVPFDYVEDEETNVKVENSKLNNAAGYWNRAVSYLDSEEANGKNQLVIRILLSGHLFVDHLPFENSLNEVDFRDDFTVKPQYVQSALHDGSPITMDFDLYPKLEATDDVTEAQLGDEED